MVVSETVLHIALNTHCLIFALTAMLRIILILDSGVGIYNTNITKPKSYPLKLTLQVLLLILTLLKVIRVPFGI